jgi:hypothetical protein
MEGNPVFELTYQDDLAGWVDCASSFEPANDDAVYLNAAIHERLVA